MIRYINDGGQPILGWKGFNISLSKSVLPKSAIYYLPFIEASPTDMVTVKTIFKRSLDMANSLNLRSIILVFGQVINSKSQEIQWNDPGFTVKSSLFV